MANLLPKSQADPINERVLQSALEASDPSLCKQSVEYIVEEETPLFGSDGPAPSFNEGPDFHSKEAVVAECYMKYATAKPDPKACELFPADQYSYQFYYPMCMHASHAAAKTLSIPICQSFRSINQSESIDCVIDVLTQEKNPAECFTQLKGDGYTVARCAQQAGASNLCSATTSPEDCLHAVAGSAGIPMQPIEEHPWGIGPSHFLKRFECGGPVYDVCYGPVKRAYYWFIEYEASPSDTEEILKRVSQKLQGSQEVKSIADAKIACDEMAAVWVEKGHVMTPGRAACRQQAEQLFTASGEVKVIPPPLGIITLDRMALLAKIQFSAVTGEDANRAFIYGRDGFLSTFFEYNPKLRICEMRSTEIGPRFKYEPFLIEKLRTCEIRNNVEIGQISYSQADKVCFDNAVKGYPGYESFEEPFRDFFTPRVMVKCLEDFALATRNIDLCEQIPSVEGGTWPSAGCVQDFKKLNRILRIR